MRGRPSSTSVGVELSMQQHTEQGWPWSGEMVLREQETSHWSGGEIRLENETSTSFALQLSATGLFVGLTSTLVMILSGSTG